MLNLFCTYSTSLIYLRPLVPLLFGLEFTVLSRCLSFICIWLKQMCLQKCCKSVQKSKRKTYVELILHIFYFFYSLTTINTFTLLSRINVPPNRLFFFLEKTPNLLPFDSSFFSEKKQKWTLKLRNLISVSIGKLVMVRRPSLPLASRRIRFSLIRWVYCNCLPSRKFKI